MIANFLSNAVKYSPNTEAIGVECEVLGDEAVVRVNDHGMGILSADIEKIFDRYHRVESDSTQHISGFGIGLYLSAEIIKRHNGKIGVVSDKGEGSTFYFSIPS